MCEHTPSLYPPPTFSTTTPRGYVPRIGSPSCATLYTPIGRPSRSASTSLPRAAAYVSAALSLHSSWVTTRLAVSHSRHWSCCATLVNRLINFFSAPRSIRLAATALASGNVLVSPPLPVRGGFGGVEDMFSGSVASTYRKYAPSKDGLSQRCPISRLLRSFVPPRAAAPPASQCLNKGRRCSRSPVSSRARAAPVPSFVEWKKPSVNATY